MINDFKNLFSNIDRPEPSRGLLAKIMRRIQQEQRLAMVKRRLTAIIAGLAGTFAVFIPVAQSLRSDLDSSGFIKFLALLFSDASVIAAYWQNYLFSLLETLPIISLIMVSATMLTFLELLKLLVKNLKNFTQFSH